MADHLMSREEILNLIAEYRAAFKDMPKIHMVFDALLIQIQFMEKEGTPNLIPYTQFLEDRPMYEEGNT